MLLNCSVGEGSWSNQSILKEISPEYSLEGLMLKLKPQYFGHLMWRTDSLEKTLMLGKTEGRRRRGREDEMVGWHHRLSGHEFEQALGVGDGQGSLQSTGSQRVGQDWAPELNWFLQILFLCLSPSLLLLWCWYAWWCPTVSETFFFLFLSLDNLNWLICNFTDSCLHLLLSP